MTVPVNAAAVAKAQARESRLLARAALPEAERRNGDEARTALLIEALRGASCVAAYASLGTEPDTSALRAGLAAAGIEVLLPRLLADGTLEFVADGPLLAGLRGTRAPAGQARPLAAADVVLLPALAVDRRGNRLGRGGGSYDRALGALPPDRLIALLHPGELVDQLPTEPHDRRVGAVALPGGITAIDPDAGWTEQG